MIVCPMPQGIFKCRYEFGWDGSTMSVFSLSPVKLRVGGDKVEHCVYVAPLQDDMLLGIDLGFLQKYWVKLYFGTGELQLGTPQFN